MIAIFELHAHEHSGHERKMKGHVELIAIGKVRSKISRPLVGFGKQHFSGELFV